MAALRLDTRGVIVACPSCSRPNRLSYATLNRTVRCGQCRTALRPPAAPVEVPDTPAFEAALATSALPLVVDFWAPWCGPCRVVAPELERVAAEANGRYLVVKVNTDQLTDVARRFGIRSIPTLGILHRGREIDRMVGVHAAHDILAFADRATAAGGRRAS